MLHNTVLPNSFASCIRFPATDHSSVSPSGNHDQSLDWKGSENTENLMYSKKFYSSNNGMLYDRGQNCILNHMKIWPDKFNVASNPN